MVLRLAPTAPTRAAACAADNHREGSRGEGSRSRSSCGAAQKPAQCAAGGDREGSRKAVPAPGFGSGGGFSWLFDRPQYQDAVVKKYLEREKASLPKAPAKFNAAGRATPDVSALGTGYMLWVDGASSPGVGGTSASAPVFAAMISLLNEDRLNDGKKPLGFLNPFLYQNADAFYDVTTGTNAHPRGPGETKYGFACAKGWDPATGLGTPKFDKLLAAALAACSLC